MSDSFSSALRLGIEGVLRSGWAVTPSVEASEAMIDVDIKNKQTARLVANTGVRCGHVRLRQEPHVRMRWALAHLRVRMRFGNIDEAAASRC